MGGSESTTVNQRIIPDATEEENALLQSLYSLFSDQLSEAPSYLNMSSDIYNQVPEALSSYLETSSDLSAGVLPEAYSENFQKSISQDVQKSVGSVINSLGNSGVLNSSVTSAALASEQAEVADAAADNYLNSLNYLSDQASAPLTALLSTGSALQSAGNSALSPALSLWETLYNGRYQNSGSTSTTTESTGTGDAIVSLLALLL